MKSRLLGLVAIAVAVISHNALAQVSTNATGTDAATDTAMDTAPAPTEDADEKAWSFSASAYAYFVPNDEDYLSPIFTADRDRLHLEARHNYEDLDTGSLWVGRNFSFGQELTLDLTLMLGGVFGNTAGIAPGYEGSLRWRELELYSEGEYVIDTRNSSDSFFYAWSELTLSPMGWFRFGLVVQRTKVYETNLDIQRGLLVGFAYKQANFTTYVFNPDQSNPTAVVSVGLDF
jgi:hypothetical protein